MFRKNRIEAVRPMAEEDFLKEKEMYRGRGVGVGGVVVGSVLGGLAGVGIMDFILSKVRGVESVMAPVPMETSTVLPVTSTVGGVPSSGIDTVPGVDGAVIPVNWLSEGSGVALATILDPIVEIMVAISFPIASVIMIGGCFFFMLGQSEKAWSIIFNCGIGFLLIQIAPMLLDIMKDVGSVL